MRATEGVDLYPTIFRSRDLPEVTRVKLREDVAAGRLLNPWRGIYVRSDAPMTGRRLAAFALRRPDAVFGLGTALDHHGLSDALSRTIDAFIPYDTRTPRFDDIPHRVVRQQREYLTLGVEPLEVLGVQAQITTPARTLIDAFRFPRLVPLQTAIDALRDYLAERPIAPLVTLAHQFRVFDRIQPYLRALQ